MGFPKQLRKFSNWKIISFKEIDQNEDVRTVTFTQVSIEIVADMKFNIGIKNGNTLGILLLIVANCFLQKHMWQPGLKYDTHICQSAEMPKNATTLLFLHKSRGVGSSSD